MNRSGGAVLALAVLFGAAVGIGAAFIGRGAEPSAGPPEDTAADATTTTVVESGFWTAVIASVEAARPDAREQADRVVDEAAAKGQEAFVLEGSLYDGLNDAYLAVCVGRFEDQAAAVEQVTQLKGLGYDPYPRDVGDRTEGGSSSDGDDQDEEG